MTTSIEVTVLGGYLGAGKTTLINHLLTNADERMVVLVNDFGAINIDEVLIEASSEQTIELANGCICCSLVDGFAAALDQVVTIVPAPDRLLIEASGVADPAQIAAYGHGPGTHLGAVAVVVDAERVLQQADDRFIGTTVERQLASADLVVLNKVDLVDDPGPVRTWLATKAPGALVVDAVDAAVSPSVLFGTRPRPRTGSTPEAANATPAAAELHAGWSFSTPHAVSRSAIEYAMAELPVAVDRVKGLIELDDAPGLTWVLQRTGTRWTLSPVPHLGPPAGCQIVAIGRIGGCGDDELAALFQAGAVQTESA